MHIRGFRFVVPTYVPAGYRVTRFEFEKGKEPMLTTVNITYSKGKSHFVLQQCSEGIGDLMMTVDQDTVEPQGTYTAFTKIWGRVGVDYFVKPRHRLWAVNWLAREKKLPAFVSLIGEGMNARLGVQIVEGLRFLN